MIRNRQKIERSLDFPVELFAPKERIVFLDLETTGLKAGENQLYLIGLAGYEEDGWRLTQYFAEGPGEEPLLLDALSDYLRQKREKQDHLILVTYNGDTFDLPFLKALERAYYKTGLLNNTVSFDLYKAIKPYRRLLNLENLKLKTVERHCGIDREDPYTGGDLIAVYEEYLRLCRILPGGCEDNRLNEKLKEKCFSCLLRHNAEDLEDLLPVMSMLSYRELMEGNFCLESVKREQPDRECPKLHFQFRLKSSLPVPLIRKTDQFELSVSEKDPLRLDLKLPLEEGERRHYYKNYREYYYLPEQDMAIHRSLGKFVDRKNRIPAAASTCYTREEGVFFPLPEKTAYDGPLFYKCLKGTPYARLDPENLPGEVCARQICLDILGSL